MSNQSKLKRRIKIIKPRLQLKLVGVFVGLAALSVLLQSVLLANRLTDLSVNVPLGGQYLVDAMPSIISEILIFTFGLVLPLIFAVGVLITHRIAGPIYRFEHQEGCTHGIDPWAPFGAGGAKDAFEGDGALPWRIVRTATADDCRQLGLGVPRVATYNGFAYLLTLGFRRASLLRRPLAPLLIGLDRARGALSAVAGLRALLTWERASPVWAGTALPR